MDVPIELLSSLCNAYGPSGYEDEVRKLIVDEIRKSVGQIEVDALGNVYAQEHPSLMLSAHMDEVGFLINYFEDSGFLRFALIGTIDARILPAQRVILRGKEKRFGVTGSKPPHVLTQDEMKKAVELSGPYIDIVASLRDEARKLGIDVLPAQSIEQAVRRSDVLITATPSMSPIVKADWLPQGIHANVVGADDPPKIELEGAALKKADKLVIAAEDCFLAGQLQMPIRQGTITKDDIHGTIGEIIAGR
jgi:hypothetical protein